MNKWTWLVLAIFAIWAIFVINWYVCGVKNLCTDFSISGKVMSDDESISISANDDEVAGRPDEDIEGGRAITTTVSERVVTEERTISCATRINSNISLSSVNNSADVVKLEQFLNDYEDEDLEIDGLYSQSDVRAVERFQEKYADAVLTPVGLSRATGNVFSSTRNHVNRLYCVNTVL